MLFSYSRSCCSSSRGCSCSIDAGGGNAARCLRQTRPVLMESQTKVTPGRDRLADRSKQNRRIIEFLKEPQKFQRPADASRRARCCSASRLGQDAAPRISSPAKQPFFSMSGSDFVEMFVGVGASRVRDLFRAGRSATRRASRVRGRNRRRGPSPRRRARRRSRRARSRRSNQPLVEMDGFSPTKASSWSRRPTAPGRVDPALLRPARFDRRRRRGLADVRAARGILKVHTRKIPLSEDVDLQEIARSTPGMAGAELANIVNEAALLAARRNHKKVSDRDFEDAKDKVMLGTERRSPRDDRGRAQDHRVPRGRSRARRVADPGSDPVTKVTIIPRGARWRVTFYTPQEERHNHLEEAARGPALPRHGRTRGRDPHLRSPRQTGAVSDLEMASNIARNMVTRYGMSEARSAGVRQEPVTRCSRPRAGDAQGLQRADRR